MIETTSAPVLMSSFLVLIVPPPCALSRSLPLMGACGFFGNCGMLLALFIGEGIFYEKA